MIRLTNLTKHYETVLALDNISLEIASGDRVVIQGPSGSGKSTLLRLISGLETPTHGEIYIGENCVSSPTGVTPPHTRGIGFVFQRSALWPHMTVKQNILFAMNNISKPQISKHLNQLLDQMELKKLAYRYPNQLSGGEARRVALARALSAEPNILLMDEPLTSLNPDLKEHLLAIICDYVHTKGITLLYVTHLVDEAQQINGRYFYMQNGRVTER